MKNLLLCQAVSGRKGARYLNKIPLKLELEGVKKSKSIERCLRHWCYFMMWENMKKNNKILSLILWEFTAKWIFFPVASLCQVLTDLNRFFYWIKLKISLSLVTQITRLLQSKLNTLCLGTCPQLSKTQKGNISWDQIIGTDFTMFYRQSFAIDSTRVSNCISFYKQWRVRWLWIIHYNKLCPLTTQGGYEVAAEW